ncbi:MAG: hypothetical protein PSY14_16570 [bacterium]|nr:hypothetical protein [bacterium]
MPFKFVPSSKPGDVTIYGDVTDSSIVVTQASDLGPYNRVTQDGRNGDGDAALQRIARNLGGTAALFRKAHDLDGNAALQTVNEKITLPLISKGLAPTSRPK